MAHVTLSAFVALLFFILFTEVHGDINSLTETNNDWPSSSSSSGSSSSWNPTPTPSKSSSWNPTPTPTKSPSWNSPTPTPSANAGCTVLEFVAAQPGSYDCKTGGGAYNCGWNGDVTSSFGSYVVHCGDIVTYLVKIIGHSDLTEAKTVKFGFEFSADTSNKNTGCGISRVCNAQVNYGECQNGKGAYPGPCLTSPSTPIPTPTPTPTPSWSHNNPTPTPTPNWPNNNPPPTWNPPDHKRFEGKRNTLDYQRGQDSCIRDDGGSRAWISDQTVSGTPYQGGSKCSAHVCVDDVECNEVIILRVDVVIGCLPNVTTTQGFLSSNLINCSCNSTSPNMETFTCNTSAITFIPNPTPRSCDDNNNCTIDTYNYTLSACTYTPKCAPDNITCTDDLCYPNGTCYYRDNCDTNSSDCTNYQCRGNQCVLTSINTCDTNPYDCINQTCNISNGQCVSTNLCQSDPLNCIQRVCNAGNCTETYCPAATACVTYSCQLGSCVPSYHDNLCPDTNTSDCLIPHCSATTQMCQYVIDPTACIDPNTTDCITYTCSATGSCNTNYVDSLCPDDPTDCRVPYCTTNGQCSFTLNPSLCVDTNTTDCLIPMCSATGVCQSVPNNGLCPADPNSMCSVPTCTSSGVCVYIPDSTLCSYLIDSSTPCLSPICTSTGCETFPNSALCPDSNPNDCLVPYCFQGTCTTRPQNNLCPNSTDPTSCFSPLCASDGTCTFTPVSSNCDYLIMPGTDCISYTCNATGMCVQQVEPCPMPGGCLNTVCNQQTGQCIPDPATMCGTDPVTGCPSTCTSVVAGGVPTFVCVSTCSTPV